MCDSSLCHHGRCCGVVAVDVVVDEQGMSKWKQTVSGIFFLKKKNACHVMVSAQFPVYINLRPHTMFATGILASSASALVGLHFPYLLKMDNFFNVLNMLDRPCNQVKIEQKCCLDSCFKM